MQVQFNKPVTIGANTYGKGQHEVPAADLKDNWFFDALVKEGSAVVLRAEEGKAQGEVANDAPAAAEHSEEAPATKAKVKTKAGAKESGDA
jgi:hypothetical protein